ncbi:MAG: ATP-binding cassette domain-containing protein [Candidatus Latescibacteria bacterium]|jgi:lipopolysaccharide transport system ATP-binding protein|nr:ATP-binding cassette domain-containing protein [Candidatus Latescibacterota bacterium]
MADTVIKIENLSKQYRLGVIGHGTLYKDIQSWWARLRSREDPNKKIMEHSGPGLDGERFWALKDISLEIEQGERIGIIGKNGAGKSTLLKILSRVTTPTKGLVKIKGRVASLLEVGTGFHQELTGRENVYLNGTILGMTRMEIRRKFDEIIEFADIEKFIDTPVKRYSSGMYVRLAFAVAAHLEPEILIVDEVLAVGDAAFQNKCLGKMQDVSRTGKTVLFVSHNMTAISKLCNKTMVLNSGKSEYIGKTEDAITHYLHSKRTEFDSKVDLRNTPRSNNNKEWIMTWISLHRIDGSESIEFSAGDDIIIRIGYEIKTPITAYCQINFLNYLDSRVMAVSSLHSDMTFAISGEGYIECLLRDVRLLSGEYTMMLDFGRTFPQREWLDFIPAATRLRIKIGNYLGGVEWVNSPGHGAVAQKSQWQNHLSS